MDRKPLGKKCYGHIPHLPGSRVGPGDHKCHEGQKRIATEKVRDKHDRIIVQEKVDGSNCGVALLNDTIYPLTRAGYVANTSPFEQHHFFYMWVLENGDRFRAVLSEGERICGEWLMQAHGTKYNLPHEPFVVFDIFTKDNKRICYSELLTRIGGYFASPRLLHKGEPFSIENAIKAIEVSGHGAIDKVEGCVWRVEKNALINPGKSGERKWVVDFLVKYVRPEKKDGIYLPEISGKKAVWNWYPNKGLK